MSADDFGRLRRAGRLGSSPPGIPQSLGAGEHLASEVIVAYVDGELRMTAYLRASRHLAQCVECLAEVEAQRQARTVLRGAEQVAMPRDLLCALTSIPDHAHFRSDLEDVSARRWALRWRR